jgi:hypothetical protein
VVDERPSRLSLGRFAFGFDTEPSGPPSVFFTSQTRAGARATRIRNSPGWTSPLAHGCSPTKGCSPIWCFLSPGAPSFTGIWLALRVGPNSTAEAPRHPYPVLLIQLSSEPVRGCHP